MTWHPATLESKQSSPFAQVLETFLADGSSFRYHPQILWQMYNRWKQSSSDILFFSLPCWFFMAHKKQIYKINYFRNPRSKPWALAIHEGCSLRPTRMSPPGATRPSTIALGATGASSSIIHHSSFIIHHSSFIVHHPSSIIHHHGCSHFQGKDSRSCFSVMPMPCTCSRRVWEAELPIKAARFPAGKSSSDSQVNQSCFLKGHMIIFNLEFPNNR